MKLTSILLLLPAIALTSAIDVSEEIMDIEARDDKRPPPNTTYMIACKHQDFHGWCIPDNKWVPWGKCFTLDKTHSNAITSYRVLDGCCAFFRRPGCTDRLFEAHNRGHGKLGKGHNDQISSYKCAKECGIRDGE
ncbi:hypothetical protein FPQ18DRAFT_399929 [Pyronema domesticum]|nr:hypothetical protein FPQ18DRAFT_399929 [Pyronema domesticum]